MLVRVRVGKARLQHKFYLSTVDTIVPRLTLKGNKEEFESADCK